MRTVQPVPADDAGDYPSASVKRTEAAEAAAALEAAENFDAALDIGSAVISGVKWKALTQVISEGSRIVVALILARLLTPKDYGVAGMAMVCVSFASLLTDPALGTALVQRRRITQADKSTVFWTTTFVGAVAAVVGVGVSGYVADLFGQPEVKKLFIALSIGLFISGFTVTQMALLARALSYRSIEIREIIATLIGAVCAVAAAFAGFGPWAIITNWLVFNAASAILVWFMTPWRPSFTFSRASLVDLGGFGLRVFGARVLSWANSNADNVLVGRYLGAPALGAYALAYNIMYVPITRISLPLINVLSPAYARMRQEPERLMSMWMRSRTLISALLAPAFAACIVAAPDLVPLAFGEKWKAAVVPVQLLSLAGLAQTLVALHWSILTALDRPGTLLRINLFVTGLTVGAFVAGLPFGIVGVAAFYAGARWLLVLLDTWWTTRAISYPFWPSLRSSMSSLPLAALAGAAGFGVRVLLIHAGVPPLGRLIVVVGAIAVVHLALLRLVSPRTLGEAWQGLHRLAG
jgi:O-antigen/teichoic acid export membrane protein